VDRSDVGGISTPSHPDLGGKSGIFIYDGHRGGVGYAEKGYDLIAEVLDGTLKAIESCPCESGCPSCIQSPKCGNNNEPLDKHAAIMLLHEILGKTPYFPPERKEKHLSEVKASRPVPEKRSTEDALGRVRRQLRRDKIKQEIPAEQKEKEKTFIATNENGEMIGVISAPAPEKAAAKTVHQKFRGKTEPTRENPLKIRIRDLGEGSDFNFIIWIEISENKGNETANDGDGKKVMKKLIIRKMK
jgi:DEAD/DEAH box helicase domain-containing protein